MAYNLFEFGLISLWVPDRDSTSELVVSHAPGDTYLLDAHQVLSSHL